VYKSQHEIIVNKDSHGRGRGWDGDGYVRTGIGWEWGQYGGNRNRDGEWVSTEIKMCGWGTAGERVVSCAII